MNNRAFCFVWCPGPDLNRYELFTQRILRHPTECLTMFLKVSLCLMLNPKNGLKQGKAFHDFSKRPGKRIRSGIRTNIRKLRELLIRFADLSSGLPQGTFLILFRIKFKSIDKISGQIEEKRRPQNIFFGKMGMFDPNSVGTIPNVLHDHISL
jgi:hypothetical protein